MTAAEKNILLGGIAYLCAAVMLQLAALILMMLFPALDLYSLTGITECLVLGAPGVLALIFWRGAVRPRRVGASVWIIPFLAIVGVFAMTYLTGFWSMFLTSLGGGEPPQNIPMPETGEQLAASMMSFSVIPALCEELFFRGMMLPAMRGRTRRGLVLTSLAFAMLHGSVTGFWGHLAIGLVLGWLTLASESLLPAIIYHFTHNAILMIIAYALPALAGQADLAEFEAMPAGAGMVAFQAVFLLGLILAFAALLIAFRYAVRRRGGGPARETADPAFPKEIKNIGGTDGLRGAGDAGSRVRFFAYIPLIVGLTLCALLYAADGMALFGADPFAGLRELMGAVIGA